MRKLTSVVAVAIAILAWSGISFAYSEGAWGLGPYPCVGLPAHAAITVDGNDADWAWFPAEYVITIDDMACTIGAEKPAKDDLDIAVKAAWSPEKLYVFVNVIDDTLNVDETSINNGWKDDRMEIIMDADHSASYAGGATGGGFREDMQQYVFDVMTPGGYHQVGSLQYKQNDVMRWAEAPEYLDAAAKVLPEGSVSGSANVTVGYEVAMTCFDWLSRDGYDASTPHVFAEGQIIGMSVTVNEADAAGRTHQVSTHTEEGGAHDPALMTEFEMLGAPTAVEPASWGTIKSLFR